MCDNKAPPKEDRSTTNSRLKSLKICYKIEHEKENISVSSDCSQPTAAAELTSVPPLLSHHSWKQHSKQQHLQWQPAAASASVAKTSSTGTSTGNSNSFKFSFFHVCCLVPVSYEHSSRRVLLLLLPLLLAAAACCCAQRTPAIVTTRSAPGTIGTRNLDRGGLTPRRCCCCCCGCCCCYRGVVELI